MILGKITKKKQQKKLKYQVFWARLASYGKLALISDPLLLLFIREKAQRSQTTRNREGNSFF